MNLYSEHKLIIAVQIGVLIITRWNRSL